MHNQQMEERRFLEDQIITAIDGRSKLQRKRDDLTEELKRLEEEGSPEKKEERRQ